MTSPFDDAEPTASRIKWLQRNHEQFKVTQVDRAPPSVQRLGYKCIYVIYNKFSHEPFSLFV